MSALLACPEILAVHTRTISDLKLRDALIVGIAQVGALIPGFSRSGSTLTAALCLDLKRDEAARFSFLLGLPAIALAGLKELWTLHGAVPTAGQFLYLDSLLRVSRPSLPFGA